jgi:16S rRNA (guanine966-N2)-methyltransferase
LRRNIATLGEEARSRVLAADATSPPKAPAAATLVFLDPPYNKGFAAPALAALAAAGFVAPGALAIVEVQATEALPSPTGYAILGERRYGVAKLIFLRYAS